MTGQYSPYHDNGPITIHYNAAGEVVKVVKVVNGITYTRTISQSDNVSASTKLISAIIPS